MTREDTHTGREPAASRGRRTPARIAPGLMAALASIVMLLAAGTAQSWDASTTVPWQQSAVIESDRPYASLVALTAARQRVDDEHDRALYASLTIGMLGLSAAESLHRAVHRATDTELPEGYAHQVSSGGEPTAKLTVARRQLLAGGGLGRGDLSILNARAGPTRPCAPVKDHRGH